MNTPDNPPPAFEDCIEPLLARAAGYSRAIVGNRADAEDSVQDAMLKGYLGFAGYDSRYSFKAWWFAIVRNCSLDLLRKRKRRSEVEWTDDANQSTSPSSGLQLGELRELLEQLPPGYRDILELRYFGECSYRELAEALRIPEGTVMSRLHAARRALAAIYRKSEL
jgi:RNA polymerase sigma-70 factor (ECF subfamily)